jgi:prepilin-type N-terminal cleavage/methylation domain-containing protein
MPRSFPKEDTVKKKSGFTLVELMVVVSIFAILAAVSVPIYRNLVGKSRSRQGENALNVLRIGMEQYRSLRFRYPDNFTQLNVAGFDYSPNATSATYGSNRSEYTVVLVTAADGQSYTATSTGHPVDDSNDDVWFLDNTLTEAVHQQYGY